MWYTSYLRILSSHMDVKILNSHTFKHHTTTSHTTVHAWHRSRSSSSQLRPLRNQMKSVSGQVRVWRHVNAAFARTMPPLSIVSSVKAPSSVRTFGLWMEQSSQPNWTSDQLTMDPAIHRQSLRRQLHILLSSRFLLLSSRYYPHLVQSSRLQFILSPMGYEHWRSTLRWADVVSVPWESRPSRFGNVPSVTRKYTAVLVAPPHQVN